MYWIQKNLFHSCKYVKGEQVILCVKEEALFLLAVEFLYGFSEIQQSQADTEALWKQDMNNFSPGYFMKLIVSRQPSDIFYPLLSC